MGQATLSRLLAGGISSLAIAVVPARALVKFNEGHDQVFVNASTSIGYDSNIFATKGGDGDIVSNTNVSLEYTRRAGFIGVNGAVGWNLGRFGSNSSENFANPNATLELVKDTGRTTGSLTLGATRASRADPDAGQRTTTMTYNAGLNWKYPVIERYSLSGGFTYGTVTYSGNNSGLVNLSTYGANTDLFYVYTSQRDLVGGYRIRISETSASSQSVDHAFTAGVSGKIVSKLNGNIRAGYQFRTSDGIGGAASETFSGLTASASVTWNVNKRFSLTGTLSKDFGTSSAGVTTDAVTANLDAQLALRARFSLYSGLGYGMTDYLGLMGGRQDRFYTWSFGVNYSLNDHFKASLTYAYFNNWSSLAQSNFERNSITLSMSTRW